MTQVAQEDLRYVQINEALWEVWDDKGLICYQVGAPSGTCYLIEPAVFEGLLAAR